jgi:myo-inositol-1(or 4)-monophosphatase
VREAKKDERDRKDEKDVGSDYRDDVARIAAALERALVVLADFTSGQIESRRKAGGDPVTEADTAVDDVLRELLPRPGEGWLSEETEDDLTRLAYSRVWVVDPVDGTREFISGIPEWSVSVGLVEDGRAVAGGIANPATGEIFLGAVGLGITANGTPAQVRERRSLAGAEVLASRTEVKRGDWEGYGTHFTVRPTGSVAYKLGLVAAGRADATWTTQPRHEWDVAAGVALVLAGGGRVVTEGGAPPVFNQEKPRFPRLTAGPAALIAEIEGEIARRGR